MNSYADIFKIIYKRTRSLLGRDAVIEIFDRLNLILNESGKIRLISSEELTYEKLEILVKELNWKIGPLSILAFRIPVKRKARRKKLKLPDLLL